MKKITLFIAILVMAITSIHAQSLTSTFHANLICHKDARDIDWGEYGTTNATFNLYKTGMTATKLEAYFDSKDNFTRATTFFIYAEEKVQEANGFAWYLYVYYSGDYGTSKTYDRTEYFEIKDQIKENQTSVRLIGYKDSTQWAWVIDSLKTF